MNFDIDVDRVTLDTCMENCSIAMGSCSIYGAASPNAKTTGAITYSLNGVLKSKAAISSLSLATLNFWSLPGVVNYQMPYLGGSTPPAFIPCFSSVDVTASLTKTALTLPALGAGLYWGCGFFFYLDTSGNVRMTQSFPVSATNSTLVDANGNSLVLCPDYNMSLLVPFCVVKVINGSASTFTPGTTALDSGSGLTVTYADLSTAFPGQPF
jgi:hypothetical protein